MDKKHGILEYPSRQIEAYHSDWLDEVIKDPDLLRVAHKALERLDEDPNRAESPKQWAKRMAALFIQVDEELTKLKKVAD